MKDPRGPEAPRSGPQRGGGCPWCDPQRKPTTSSTGRLCAGCEELYVIYTTLG